MHFLPRINFRSRWAVPLALAAILLLGLGLRLVNIGAEPY